MCKKFVITGSHSVGKTTLVESVAGRLSSSGRRVAVIPEMARLLIAEGVPMNADIDEYGVCCYLEKYLRMTREIQSDLVISDRAVFDLFVYLLVNKSKAVRKCIVDLVGEIVRQEMDDSTYVYVPVEFAMVSDGVRPEDEAYRLAVDAQARSLLDEFGASYVVLKGSLESRIEQLLKIIGEDQNCQT